MKKKLLLTIIACLSAFLHTDAFKLESTFTEDITTERTIERTDSGITVSYTFYGGVIKPDELYPDRVRLDIPMFGNNGVLEEPAYPMRNDSFEIPEGFDATVSVISADWCNLDIKLSPARPLLVDSSDEVFSLDNVPPVKECIGTLPETPVAIYDHQIYRDRKILYVTTMPVKCIDNKKTMACNKLVYRIDFIPSEEKRDPNMILHEVDEKYMACMFTSTIYGDKKAGRYNSDKSKEKKDSDPSPSEKKVSKPAHAKSKFPIPNRNQRKRKLSPIKSSTQSTLSLIINN